MSDNQTRRERAEDSLRSYIEARGEVFEGTSSEAADLIADLLHYIAALDEGPIPIGFESLMDKTIQLAELHFNAEHGNPEEET